MVLWCFRKNKTSTKIHFEASFGEMRLKFDMLYPVPTFSQIPPFTIFFFTENFYPGDLIFLLFFKSIAAAQCLFSGSSTKHHSTIPASVPSLLPLPPNTRLSLATPWILSSGPPLGFWDPSPAQPRKGTHSLRSLFPEDPSSPSS